MSARLYFDDDVGNNAIMRELRGRGFDVTSSAEVGMRGRPDADHLRFAADAGRVMVSGNRGDFARLHGQWVARGEHHSGIILIEQRMAVGSRVRAFAELLRELNSDEFEDRVEYLKQWLPPSWCRRRQGPLPPDLAVDVLWLVFPLCCPEVAGEVLPTAIREEADDVLLTLQALRDFDCGLHHGAATDTDE